MSNFFCSPRRRLVPGRGAAWLGFPWMVMAASASPLPVQAGCPQQLPAVNAWSDREDSLRTQQQLPETCLKRLVRQCDADADAGFLDGGSAATCSLRYEALLRRGFHGDFSAFLRWWQSAPPVASQQRH